MDKLFGSLKGLLKIQTNVIDNNAFRLHYKITVPILIAFSLLVTSKQYIGDPIDCISKDDVPTKILDTYCWIHATFSVEEAWFKKVGEEVPYPGVDNYKPGMSRTYHAYYQWVCFVLFFQAILFYLPRFAWKALEGGRVKNLMMDLNSPILNSDKKKNNREMLVDYFAANFHHHNLYFIHYFICEILNVVNVIGQMYLMNTFLGGQFTSYGSKVLQFSEWDWSVRYDPMIRVFPRITKCTFHRFGSSGDVQKYDSMCILPINIINEKIYVFLWFWFVFLAVVSCLAVVYRIVLVVSPTARFRSLKNRSALTDKRHLKLILEKCRVGDWFILQLLAKNLHSLNFRDFMEEFSKRLENKGVPEA